MKILIIEIKKAVLLYFLHPICYWMLQFTFKPSFFVSKRYLCYFATITGRQSFQQCFLELTYILVMSKEKPYFQNYPECTFNKIIRTYVICFVMCKIVDFYFKSSVIYNYFAKKNYSAASFKLQTSMSYSLVLFQQ